MSKYIDADALKEKVEACFCDFKCVLPDIKNMIDEMPTADVTPVRHGQWVYDEYEYAHCSECGFEFENREFVTPYCSNCGAKMEGGDTHE